MTPGEHVPTDRDPRAPELGERWRDTATGYTGTVTEMRLAIGEAASVVLEACDGTGIRREVVDVARLAPAGDAEADQPTNAPPEVQLSLHAEGDGQVMSPAAARRIALWMTRVRARLEVLETALDGCICTCTLAKKCARHSIPEWEDEV